jgi:hypothetical protein
LKEIVRIIFANYNIVFDADIIDLLFATKGEGGPSWVLAGWDDVESVKRIAMVELIVKYDTTNFTYKRGLFTPAPYLSSHPHKMLSNAFGTIPFLSMYMGTPLHPIGAHTACEEGKVCSSTRM